jgi:tRNA pseudouridine55 synthase
MHGALLVDKHPGVSSFGIIELLQRELCKQLGVKRKDLPKMGHGGTLDPFATGLLVICVGRAVKLARYFLGSDKGYEGVIKFGETTVPGDPTAPISESTPNIPGPEALAELRALATKLTAQPYLQTPPMHSAKKKDGRPLYELARLGIEVEREPKLCTLKSFEIQSYEAPRAAFSLKCTPGTYVRTLAQDFARLQGSLALLESLRRVSSGSFHVKNAWTVEKIAQAMLEGQEWDELPCWIRFDDLLAAYDRAEATQEEARALMQGRGAVLFNILKRTPPAEVEDSPLAIYCDDALIGIARRERGVWGIERIFTREASGLDTREASGLDTRGAHG